MSFRKVLFGGLVVASIAAAVALSSDAEAQSSGWSPECTPDLVHVFPTYLAVRCNGTWYSVSEADTSSAHVDRVLRAVQAVQLSGNRMLFHYIADLPGGGKKFDVIALPK